MEESDEYITIEELGKRFVKRANQDRDATIAITGYEGEGKSTAGVGLMISVLKENGKTDDEIKENFNNYMVYSPNKEELEKKIKNGEKYMPVNSDEAIKALYKLNWASPDQKFLNVLYALCRKENKISIFCMPRFTDLGEYFRNHRIMYWIHVLDRGVGVLMVKDWNPFTRDPWHLVENEKLLAGSKYRKTKIIDYDVADKIRMLQKTTNFVSIVKFDDLAKDIKKIYLEGKEKYGYENMDQVKSVVGINAKVERLTGQVEKSVRALKELGFSQGKIAQTLNIGKTKVAGILNEDLNSTQSPDTILINKTAEDDNFDESMEGLT